MTNSPKPPPIDELWDDLGDAPPTPEEQAAARAMANALDANTTHTPNVPDIDILHLLRHSHTPPTLSHTRKAEIAQELFGTPDTQTHTTTPPWWHTLQGWLSIKPMAAVAVAALIMILNAPWHTSPTPHKHTPHTLQVPPLAKAWSSSPWTPGTNPFQVTRSPTERIERVVDHLSEHSLETTLEQQSHQVLLK